MADRPAGDPIPAMLEILALRVWAGSWSFSADENYAIEEADAYVGRVVANIRTDERSKIIRRLRRDRPRGELSAYQQGYQDAHTDIADQIEREGR